MPTAHQLQAEGPTSNQESTAVNQSHHQASTPPKISVRLAEEPRSRAEPPPRGKCHNNSTQTLAKSALASPLAAIASANIHRQIDQRGHQNPTPETKLVPSTDAPHGESLPQHRFDQDAKESRLLRRKNSK